MLQTRIALAAAALFMTLAIIAALPANTAEAADAENSEWPTAHHDWARTGYTGENLPDNLELLWTFRVEGNYSSGTNTSPNPAVAYGKVYSAFGASSVGSDAIYAVDAENGEEVWKYPVGDIRYLWVPSPTVVDGKVYVGSADNRLYVLDAENGELIWAFDIPENEGLPTKDILGAPVVGGGFVFFGSWNRYFYALNSENGSLVWKFEADGPIFASPTFANNTIYFGTGEGGNSTYALNAENGDLIWNVPIEDLGGKGEIVTSLVNYNNLIFMGGGWTERTVYALKSENGSLLWSFETNSASDFAPAIAGNKVIFSDRGGSVYAFEMESGNLVWKSETRSGLDASPVVTSDKIFVGSLYSLSVDNGSIIWSYPSNAYTGSSLAIGYGKVFLPYRQGIYAFGAPASPPQPTDASLIPYLASFAFLIIAIVSILALRKMGKL